MEARQLIDGIITPISAQGTSTTQGPPSTQGTSTNLESKTKDIKDGLSAIAKQGKNNIKALSEKFKDGKNKMTKAFGNLKSKFSGMRGAGGGRFQAILFVVEGISKLIIALLVIFFVCLIVYVVYLCYTRYYLRRISIGHTEPFEIYMVSYFKEFFAFAREVNEETKSGSAIQSFITAYNQLLASLIVTNVSSEEKETETSSIPNDKLTLNQDTFAVNDIPYFYLMFMFNRAIDHRDIHELSLMDKFIKREFVSKFYLPNQTSIGDISPLVQLKASFDNMRQTIQSESQELQTTSDNDKHPEQSRSRIAIYMLDLMLNDYLNEIKQLYNMRKSGGRSWIFFIIYMGEYSQFVFGEEIPRIWKPFIDDIASLADAYQTFLVSDPVQSFVEGLPLKIAGIENFTNKEQNKPDNETWWSKLNPLNSASVFKNSTLFNKSTPDKQAHTSQDSTKTHTNKPDVIEHMSIGGFFSAIGKIFPALFKILISIVNVINNPINFIRWILGLLIGFTIYIIYLVICALSFLFYIPAFFIILIIDAIFTAFWVLLWLALAAFYLILTLLDILTGGNILPLFRCENLPNAWTHYPNYVRDNKYKRSLLCMYKCGNRFAPSTGGLMCSKIAAAEPMYAPHQLIYNAYMEHFDPLKQVPFRYSYTPTIKYFQQNLEERTSLWRSVYHDTQDYMTICAEKMQPYDHIIKEMCLHLTSSENFATAHKTEHDQVVELCKITYCIGDDKNKFDYCSAEDSVIQKDVDQGIIHKVIVQSLALVILVLIIISMQKLTSAQDS